MKHIALLGGGSRLLELAKYLRRAGFAVTLLPDPSDLRNSPPAPTSPALALAEASCIDHLQESAKTAKHHAMPWLFLCGETPEEDLAASAYRAGALAVLPAGSSIELAAQATERALGSLQPPGAVAVSQSQPRRRHYRAGETIPLRIDETLRILTGVAAQIVWHKDGGEGLVGLWGKGTVLSGHPEDACSLLLRAHTEMTAEIDHMVASADLSKHFAERIRRLEAWSSMQSRQNMEDRLLGILTLLAEQFGEAFEEDVLIDVRVTHAQLANAIGATRATVTRLLGPLRRSGRVRTVTTSDGERFCLPGRRHDGHGGGCGHHAAEQSSLT